MIKKFRNLAQAIRTGAVSSKNASKSVKVVSRRLNLMNKRLNRGIGRINKRLETVEWHLSSALPQLVFSELPASSMRCPVCQEGHIRWTSAYPSHLERFRMAVLLFCDRCGSGHMPDAARILGDYYTVDYGTTNRKDRSVDPAAYFNSNSPKLANYFNRARHQVESLKQRGATFGKVLDYGSGPGYFLHVSQAVEPYAVELDTASDKYLEYLGVRKIAPDALPSDFFDVVLCSHVVEHFTAEDLQANIQSMVRSLKQDGLLLIEVPNGSLSRVRYRGDQSPHTLFFTPEGIRRAVQLAGGNVVDSYARFNLDRNIHANPVYFPDLKDEYVSTTHQGLTVIARRC